MKTLSRSRIFVALALLLSLAPVSVPAADWPIQRWTVDGVERRALVYAPPGAITNASPVIFAFHGHSGTMNHAAQTFDFQKSWPEAIVVYMQGLNTPGRLVDHDGRQAGWQFVPGGENDRDLKFFDAVLASLRKYYRVDEKRIYATGHSNGGGFTYVLWAARGDTFAAVAPCACVSTFQRSLDDHAGYTNNVFKPKPVLHLAGEKDPLVKFAWQKASIDGLLKLDQCGDGQPWEKYCTLYSSKIGAPVVTFIHPGGHEYPPEASATIVKFFKENPKP